MGLPSTDMTYFSSLWKSCSSGLDFLTCSLEICFNKVTAVFVPGLWSYSFVYYKNSVNLGFLTLDAPFTTFGFFVNFIFFSEFNKSFSIFVFNKPFCLINQQVNNQPAKFPTIYRSRLLGASHPKYYFMDFFPHDYEQRTSIIWQKKTVP